MEEQNGQHPTIFVIEDDDAPVAEPQSNAIVDGKIRNRPAYDQNSADARTAQQIDLCNGDDDVVFINESGGARADGAPARPASKLAGGRRRRSEDGTGDPDRPARPRTRSQGAPAHGPAGGGAPAAAAVHGGDGAPLAAPRLAALAPGSAEYAEVQALVLSSIQNITVDAIEAVEDPPRLVEHARLAAALRAAGTDPNPTRLYLCAPSTAWQEGYGAAAAILRDGFACATLVGRADVSFTASACIADFCLLLSPPRRRILLFDVLAVMQPVAGPAAPAPAAAAAGHGGAAGGAAVAEVSCVLCEVGNWVGSWTFVCLHDEQAAAPPMSPPRLAAAFVPLALLLVFGVNFEFPLLSESPYPSPL